MQATPWFLGACALASFTGAVSGANINTHPLQKATIGSDEIARPAIAFDPADTGHDSFALPDHYAMTTPEGLVPVAALSTRGIYSQRRYGLQEATFVAPPAPTYFAPEPQITDRGAGADETDTAASPSAGPSSTGSPPPADQADGEPRLIDVAAVLASRQ
jgi:hypothetical protein